MRTLVRLVSSLSLALALGAAGLGLAGCNGPRCGDHFCRLDQVCCSDSCGICGTQGGVCPTVGMCSSGDGGPVVDGGAVDAPAFDMPPMVDGAMDASAVGDGALADAFPRFDGGLAAKTGVACGDMGSCAAGSYCVVSNVGGARCQAMTGCGNDPTCNCFASSQSTVLECYGNPMCMVDSNGVIHCDH